jgi:5-methylcytosine-specific restriction enzyme subunit McrC
VLDTKYKGSDSHPDDDIKQVAFYAMAKECSLALLIYPTPLITPIDITIRGIRVKSLTFALDGDLEHAGNEFIHDLLALQPEIQVESIEGSLNT